MKTKTTGKQAQNLRDHQEPTVFEHLMNINVDLRAELGIQPIPAWKQTRPTPEWARNVHGTLRRTIFKSILKLKPNRRRLDLRGVGRMVGFVERGRMFFQVDALRILRKEGFHRLSKTKQKKLEAMLGEEQARLYYLKVLGKPADAKTPLEELWRTASDAQWQSLERHKEIILAYLSTRPVKSVAKFYKGLAEGHTIFLNEFGEFTGDDRRTAIHLELLAWQYDIEKMRRAIPSTNRKELFGQLRKLPEFKNKTQDWFNDVCKDIKLSIGQRGRPRRFSTS